MQNTLTDSILGICKVLNKKSVQYLLVGGAAVALHGYYRISKNLSGVDVDKPDLAFWYNPTYKNYFSLLNAIEELGQDVSEFKKEKTPSPKTSYFRFDLEKFSLDFLPKLKAPIRFQSAFEKKEIVTIAGIDIPFICFDDLILDKETSPRPKDQRDIEELKKNKRLNK